MKDFATLVALPTSLLCIVAVYAQELPWPYNLPRTVKYYPEHEAHVKREAEVQERLAWQAPAAVKKMNSDLDEKFFLDYWGFRGQPALGSDMDNGKEEMCSNAPLSAQRFSNASLSLYPAIAPHSNFDTSRSWLSRRNIFKRDFVCPAGTRSCSSIGANNLCCQLSETCVSTSDGVGCCPAGAACGDDVSGCDTTAGFTSCPNSPNGGCCIPGAVCEGVGCVFQGRSTRTVTRTLSTATQTNGVSFTTRTSSGRTITVAYPVTKISVTTETVTITPTGYPSSSSDLTCKMGFFSCPGPSGGGCCPTGQACGTSGSCPDFTISTDANPPVLPTSVSPETEPTTVIAGCPTGFYMCSAVYLGGCCRVGRDCHTTNCPPQDTTTIINSPVTVAETASDRAAFQDSCANGWYLCGAAGGGGCCPSGYVCGGVSCSATVSGQRDTLKMAPNSANVQRWAWSFFALGLFTGIGMIVA